MRDRKADIAIVRNSKLQGSDKLSKSIESAIRHTKEFFECGGLPHAILTDQNNSNFFEPKGSSKDFLVGVNSPGFNSDNEKLNSIIRL